LVRWEPNQLSSERSEPTAVSLVSNSNDTNLMVRRNQLRRILPISQTALALFFGGWGIWIRDSILSRTFFGDSTLWNSTARFHVWPWPYKFAVVLNMPAFLIGLLLSWPLDALRPGLPESVSALPVLLLVPLLWYSIGSWLDQRRSADEHRSTLKRQHILLLVFTLICGVASSIPEGIGGYVSYLPLGILIWAAVGLAAFVVSRKYNSSTV